MNSTSLCLDDPYITLIITSTKVFIARNHMFLVKSCTDYIPCIFHIFGIFCRKLFFERILQEIIKELGGRKEIVQSNHPITHCNKMSYNMLKLKLHMKQGLEHCLAQKGRLAGPRCYG